MPSPAITNGVSGGFKSPTRAGQAWLLRAYHLTGHRAKALQVYRKTEKKALDSIPQC